MAALTGALVAGSVACESKALQGGGGAGGASATKLGGDAGVDRSIDAMVAALGAACTSSATCASEFCVEGVCCSSACINGCQTCSAAGAVGTCLARAAGSAPRQATDCPLDAPASCGLDGTCDGVGACRLYLGNICQAGVCASGVVTGAFACDGEGVCRSGASIICAPYGCDPVTNQCLSACQNDGQCSTGRHCQSGFCAGDPGLGLCTRNEQCFSGYCADGVCCDTACAGPCVSCALPGTIGTCTPVPNSPDAGACTP